MIVPIEPVADDFHMSRYIGKQSYFPVQNGVYFHIPILIRCQENIFLQPKRSNASPILPDVDFSHGFLRKIV